MSIAMKYLYLNTFWVPVIYKHSPLAYSIVNDIHRHSNAAKDSGVKAVWKYVLKLGYMMQGRDLVKKVKKNCERCRYLREKAIDSEMGPVSTHNLRIAPAFYVIQVDFCGLFKAYSPYNKGTTI